MDFFALPNPVETLKKLLNYQKSISISTKARIAEPMVRKLAELNTIMNRAACFLKISVSFSTKYRVSELEIGTASFEERLNMLQLLKEYRIPHCGIIKPVLPGVPVQEYLEIVDALSSACDGVVVGGLYLDDHDSRIKGLDPSLQRKKVTWAKDNPIWPTIPSTKKIEAIVSYARSKGLLCYHSDLAFMERLQSQFSDSRLKYDSIVQ
jgi:hypothetical protein